MRLEGHCIPAYFSDSTALDESLRCVNFITFQELSPTHGKQKTIVNRFPSYSETQKKKIPLSKTYGNVSKFNKW